MDKVKGPTPEQHRTAITNLLDENARLRTALYAPLSSAEQRLIDKHCDWVAFGHAWNAVMKRRHDAVIEQRRED